MPRLATIEELRVYADVKGQGKEAALVAALEGAEAFAERYTGRHFSPLPPLVDGEDVADPVTKSITVRSAGSVRVPDLRTVVSASFEGGAIDFEALEGDEENPATHVYPEWDRSVRIPPGKLMITGRWGFLEMPADVRDAVLALAARRYRERDAAFSDAVQTPEGGVFNYFRSMPASVKGALDLHRVPRLALV